MRISDWSSDVCSSDLRYHLVAQPVAAKPLLPAGRGRSIAMRRLDPRDPLLLALPLEETVLAYRAAQGALCFGAFKQDEIIGRSAERRGGKEGVSTGRSRWSRYH